MTKNQRLEIETILKDVFNGFEDERLKGTYYPIEGMEPKKMQELVIKKTF